MTNKPQWLRSLKARLLILWRSHHSPHEIASGMAIGVFIGITPFYGLHILTAILMAFLFKHVNKVAIFLGMNISLPPTIPFITWAGYSLGRLILGGNYPPLSWQDFKHFSFETFARFFYALTLGSLLLATILSILAYGVTFLILKYRHVGSLQPKWN